MIKKAKLLRFQKDLQSGMTLEAALIKHELTFKYAVKNMPRPLTKTKKKKRRKR